jgi:ribulose-phosphate 3-epimerase
MEIYPSLISSDLLNLRQTISQLDAVCHGYHIDIMDDHFVPNLTWGAQFSNAIRKSTKLPLHIHLMVDEPTHWLERLETRSHHANFLQPDTSVPLHLQLDFPRVPEQEPVDIIFFHQETLPYEQQHDFIEAIHDKGFHAGIAINPKTDIASIFHLQQLDAVLLMSVQPGFSGQKFISETVDKIKPLRAFQQQHNQAFTICMDGGVNEHNIATLADHGIDQVAVASALFDTADPVKALKNLYALTHA